MATSSKEAQNENESQKEADTSPSESREIGTPNHSRSNSAVSPPTWRLVFLSSKLRQATVLNSAARSSVLIVPYKYDSTTLDSLLNQAQQILSGRKAESIAFLLHGQGSNTVLCSNDDQVKCFPFVSTHLPLFFSLRIAVFHSKHNTDINFHGVAISNSSTHSGMKFVSHLLVYIGHRKHIPRKLIT